MMNQELQESNKIYSFNDKTRLAKSLELWKQSDTIHFPISMYANF